MKQLSMALLALATSLSAAAQKNRVSLNVYSLSASMSEAEDPSMPGKFDSKGFSVLPAIGYYRMVKGGTGVGLELGYNRARSTNTSTYQPPGSIGTIQYEERKTSFDEFYVCPSLFQVVTTANKKYRFIPAIGVPVRYIPDMKWVETQRTTRQETGELIDGFYSQSASARVLRIGLFASTAAQIRVAGGLYAGLQLGAGINYSRQTTYGDAVRILNQGFPGERRTVSPSPDNLNQNLSFEFQPAISLNYFF